MTDHMKQEEKTEITRKKILKAATVEFGGKGYAAASLNTICSTGISKGLLYHNFDSKDAVYLACVKQCFSALTVFLRGQAFHADMRQYMEARQLFFREHPFEARLFLEAVLQPPEKLSGQIDGLREEFDALNRSLFREMLGGVTLRKGVTEEDAVSYFTLIQNLFNEYYSNSARCGKAFSEVMEAHEKGISRMLDFLLYGIAEGGRCE